MSLDQIATSHPDLQVNGESPPQRKRPAANGASSKSLAGDGSIIAPFADDWQRLAAHVNGAFVVLVETSHGKYRRRCWLTLAPAERAAQKAQDAGHNAVVVLCELSPLYLVEGAAPKLSTYRRLPGAQATPVIR